MINFEFLLYHTRPFIVTRVMCYAHLRTKAVKTKFILVIRLFQVCVAGEGTNNLKEQILHVFIFPQAYAIAILVVPIQMEVTLC